MLLLHRALLAVGGPAAGGGFSPADLFPANGAYYDISVTSSLWQNSGRTTAVTADGDPVGCIDDLSGNGNHITQATSGLRPIYRTSSGLHWVESQSNNQVMAINIPVSGWASGTGITAQRQVSGNGTCLTWFGSYLTETSHDGFSGTIYSEFGSSVTANGGNLRRPVFGSIGTSDVVMTRVADSSSLKIYLDKVQNGSTATINVQFNQGTGGISTTGQLFGFESTMRFYGGIIIEGTLSAGNLSDAETWCGNLQGRSI